MRLVSWAVYFRLWVWVQTSYKYVVWPLSIIYSVSWYGVCPTYWIIMPSYWLLWLNQCSNISGYNYSQARYIPGALLKVLFHEEIPHLLLSFKSTLEYNYSSIVFIQLWVHFSSITQLWSTLCNPKDCSTQGLPVHHQLPELAQTHVHWVSDAIQPSHSLWSPFPSGFNFAQHQGVFQWVSSSHQVAKVLELQLQHQSFQRIFRTDFL